MNEELKDLEVLEKYLSEKELKEVAKEVAYNTFNRYLGKENLNKKSNMSHFIRWGAYEAVKKHITENDFKEEEFVDKLRGKVDKLINRLTPFELNLNETIKEAIGLEKPRIQSYINKTVDKYLGLPDDDYDSMYSKLNRSTTDMLQDFVITKFIESVKKEDN